MKILVVHNLYQQAGGEDVVVRLEVDLLAKAGHEVRLELVTNDDIVGFRKKFETFLATPYSPRTHDWMDALLSRFPADVVHIHNFFPLLTLSVHEAAARRGAAVVQTLHNYRLLCANALLSRNGTVCEKCLGGSRHWAMIHRCYRRSLPGTFAVTRMQQRAVVSTWIDHVDQFIALTEFARSKFSQGGLPPGKISVKPNFLPDAPSQSDWPGRKGALFVGRLSQEKGASMLVEHWHKVAEVPLTIVGDGPQRTALERAAPPNVRFLGWLDRAAVLQQMQSAKVLIVPSLFYEGFPMTVVEALSSGLPVVCSSLGSLAEIVKPGQQGLHFRAGDGNDMASVVRNALLNEDRLVSMGATAAATFVEQYGPISNLAALERVYALALNRAAARRTATARA